MATFPSPDPADEDTGLYSKAENDQIAAIQRSDVWQAVQDALCWRREQLFGEGITDTSALWKNRGAIEEIQALLQNGPRFVVDYQRFMRRNEQPTSTPRQPPTMAGDNETPEL